jgi:hypothetical protein
MPMSASNTNNTGIMHLMRTGGGGPVCRKPRAIMATTAERFINDPKQCKRCAALLAKWQAKKTPQPGTENKATG